MVWLQAEFATQCRPLGTGRRHRAHDIPGEVEVLFGPLSNVGQSGAEVLRHNVFRIADEYRAVAQPRKPCTLLDHLGVVVGGEHAFAGATVGHRQPSDEIRHPGELEPLEFRVLVQVVVHFPGLVRDDQIGRILGDDLGEHHEVGDENLVHAAERFERVQIVFA
jgi:hypothetical protein